jgi:hypothetical protein
MPPGELVTPDDTLGADFPELNFQDAFTLKTAGEPLLVCDPNNLLDIFNDTGAAASFLREHGVFLCELGGDVDGLLLWQPPYLILRAADAGGEQGTVSDGPRVATDSGCFVFLPLRDDLPAELRAAADRALSERSAAAVSLPPGTWKFYYEQLTPEEDYPAEFYRNVVAVNQELLSPPLSDSLDGR